MTDRAGTWWRAPALAALALLTAGGLVACGAAGESSMQDAGTSATVPAPSGSQASPGNGSAQNGGTGGSGENAGGGQGTTGPDPSDQGWSDASIVVLVVGVVVLAAGVGFLMLRPRPARRRPRPRPRPTTTRVAVAPPPSPIVPRAREDTDDPFPVDDAPPPSGGSLRSTLQRIGDRSPSGAIAEQVRRLLDGRPTREELIDACIRYRDQLSERDPELAVEILRGLDADGVAAVDADGEVFDPARHDAVGNVPTDSPGLHDMIAETVRPGFREGLRTIRPPEVVVYRHAREPAGQDQ